VKLGAAVVVLLALGGCASTEPPAAKAPPSVSTAPRQVVNLGEAQRELKILKEVPPTKGSQVVGVVTFPSATKPYWVDFDCVGKGIAKVSYGGEGFTLPCGGSLPMRNHFEQAPPIGQPFRVEVPDDNGWALRVQQ
jgi:hypothetical protein